MQDIAWINFGHVDMCEIRLRERLVLLRLKVRSTGSVLLAD